MSFPSGAGRPGRPPGSERHAGPLLELFRTGELSQAEAEQVRAHLAGCQACARELEELEAFASLVARGFRASREAAARAGREPDWERQRRRILAGTAERGRAARRPALGAYLPQAALAAGAALVLVVLLREGVRGPGETSPTLREDGPRPELLRRESRDPAAPRSSTRQPGLAGGADTDSRPGDAAAGPAESPREDAAAAADGPAARAEPGFARAPARADAPVAAEEADLADERARGDAPAPAREPDFAFGPAEVVERAAGAKRARRADDLARLEALARRALASNDSLDAARAVAFWRDSLASGSDLDAAEGRAATALVDSVAAIAGPERRE